MECRPEQIDESFREAVSSGGGESGSGGGRFVGSAGAGGGFFLADIFQRPESRRFKKSRKGEGQSWAEGRPGPAEPCDVRAASALLEYSADEPPDEDREEVQRLTRVFGLDESFSLCSEDRLFSENAKANFGAPPPPRRENSGLPLKKTLSHSRLLLTLSEAKKTLPSALSTAESYSGLLAAPPTQWGLAARDWPPARPKSPPRPPKNRRSCKVPTEDFRIDLDRVYEVGKTALNIKNIPNKYTKKMLMELFDKSFAGAYTFFYLPIDYTQKCNMGFAFIVFEDLKFIRPFCQQFHNKKWPRFNSEKICEIRYARLQKMEDLVSHFQNSSIMKQNDPQYKPFIRARDSQRLKRDF